MTADAPLTAEQYAEQKYDFPEGGRWTELVAGRVIHLHPPDDAHGNFVRNLSTALGAFAHAGDRGYAAFELGLILRRDPDTVRCPPVCFFTAGERFAELDRLVTDTRPALVVELASTNDRRRTMADRVQEYLDAKIPLVWVADSHTKQIHAFEPKRQPRQHTEPQTLYGGSVLDGFQCVVGEAFADPTWWRDKPRRQQP